MEQSILRVFSTRIPFRVGAMLAIGAVLGILSACAFIPKPIAGLPSGEGWFALPLSQWLSEGRAEPEGIAACPSCGHGLAVGIVEVAGQEADEAEVVLKHPERLAQALSASKDKIRIRASVQPLTIESQQGFRLAMIRSSPPETSVYGVALGQRVDGKLRVILVIGGDAEAVEGAARQVTVEQLGS